MKGAEPPARDVKVGDGSAAPAPGTRWLWAVLAFAVAIVASPRPARAEVLVSLEYQVEAALLNCPSAADFRQEIARQIGRDPFRDNAPRKVMVHLHTAGARMAGRVEWRDARDQWEGERAFSSRNESCVQMARSMALATAIQIQLLDNLDQGLAQPATPVEAKPPPPSVSETKPAVIVPAPVAVADAGSSGAGPGDPRIGVSVGVGIIRDLSDAPAFVAPRLAVSLAWASGLGVRLCASAFGPGAKVSRIEGAAQLDRLLLTLELVRFFRTGRAVQPVVSVGGGLQDVRVNGSSAMPSVAPAHDGHAFGAVATASGGVAILLASRLFLIVEVQTFLYRPPVTIQIANTQAADFGGTALFVHGGLLARF